MSGMSGKEIFDISENKEMRKNALHTTSDFVKLQY
jgi:hypothetical protein